MERGKGDLVSPVSRHDARIPGVSAAEPAAAGVPVETGARIHALDALRGIALLGILIANVRQLFLPWDIADFPVARGAGAALAWLDWHFFYAFVSQKFLTIFSLLFGIGFALQAQRLKSRGQPFAAIYLRRVAFLALFGIAHALLLYPAEVLMPYAVTALLLLAAHGFSPRALLRTGLVLLGATTLWAYQLGSLGEVYALTTLAVVVFLIIGVLATRRYGWGLVLSVWAAVLLAGGAALTLEFANDAAAQREQSSVAREYREAQTQLAAMHVENAEAWPDEYRVRKEAGFAALVQLHAHQYALILAYFAILLLWRTLGVFMIGAAAFRSGLLADQAPGHWRRIAMVGLGVGVPLSLLATGLHGFEIRGRIDWRFSQLLHEVASLPMAAGIVAAVLIWHARSARRWLWDRFEAAGRMALTNYVGQSFVMAALAEPWGLGLYGEFGGPVLTLIALAVFAALALLSHAWLQRYRMGPLEWLWRCGTYWRRLPMR